MRTKKKKKKKKTDWGPTKQALKSWNEVIGATQFIPGWDSGLSHDTQHQVPRSITTPFGWDSSPPQDTQHEATRSITTPTQHEVARGIASTHGWNSSPTKDAKQEVTTPPEWHASPLQVR